MTQIRRGIVQNDDIDTSAERLLELSLNAKSRPVEGALGRFPEEDRDVDVAVLARSPTAETPEEVDSDDRGGSLREVARDARPHIFGVHIDFIVLQTALLGAPAGRARKRWVVSVKK